MVVLKIGLQRKPTLSCSALRNAGFPLSPAGGGSAKNTVSLRTGVEITLPVVFFHPCLGMQHFWEAGPRQRGTGQTPHLSNVMMVTANSFDI